jgi:hypothetical protein
MNTQAIASHLNILDSAIIEIQEWASVLWVRFVGGVRFVSKTVGAKKMTEANLVEDLKSCSVPVRSCDPIQVWEAHPVVSQYLDLSDRQIARAIDKAFDVTCYTAGR